MSNPSSLPSGIPGRSAGRNIALLSLGVVGVSMAAPLIAFGHDVPALALAMWRGGLAAVILAPLALRTRRRELASLPRHTWLLSCLAGVLLAVHFSLWIASLALTTVAASTALVCMQAGWTVVLTRLLGARVPRAVWVGCWWPWSGLWSSRASTSRRIRAPLQAMR